MTTAPGPHLPSRDNGPNWRLGRQSSCDCRNAHKDDEELEGQGKTAIRFELVDSHKQYTGNDADAEDVQHSDTPQRRRKARVSFPLP